MPHKPSYQKLFDDKADLYRDARPHYPAALYEILAELCSERTCAWDAACGNGQAALGLVNHFKQVLASDISMPQLRQSFPHECVQYTLCLSESVPAAQHQFDLICVAQALHWFDYDHFWPEVSRVLKPGGIFAAWGYSWLKGDDPVNRLIDREISAVVRPYWAPQLQILWNRFRDVPFPFDRLDVPPFELVLEWDLNALFGYVHSWSAVRRYMEINGDSFFTKAYEHALPIWGYPQEKKEIRMELFVLAGRKP